MSSHPDLSRLWNRRTFLSRSGSFLGSLALASLLNRELFAERGSAEQNSQGILSELHFAPTARRVIYLFMSGGPSHLDLFDPKPKLTELDGQELPPSVRGNQRLAQAAGQPHLSLMRSPFRFQPCGKSGVELSEILPHTARIIDEIALVRSVYTEPINHDPGVMFLLTGAAQPGRPTLGAWLAYGLGSVNKNLPEFLVLLSGRGVQPLQTRYWGAGFLPSQYQGVPLRATGDPILYVSNPPGIDADSRRNLLDALQVLNRRELDLVGDPEIAARIAAYEMAYRMQTSAPELMDLSKEPAKVFARYNADPAIPSFARNCLLARRLAERDVRFVQLYHRDWDHHENLARDLKKQCAETDQPVAALIEDLKERGLLDSTLVIWGGEFGRTAFSQTILLKDKPTPTSLGRDHHPRCFSMWLAGGGIKPGTVIGKTDEFGYNIVEDPVHVHDLNATILRCLGIDHKKLTYRSQGRDFRLTDVQGEVVDKLLA